MKRLLAALLTTTCLALPALAASPVCNGTVDDTAALQAQLNTGRLILPSPASAAVPAKCVFTQPLVAPSVNTGVIAGDGPYSTMLVYGGSSTTGDLLQIGDGVQGLVNWNLSNFRIVSRTRMTSGNAIHIRGLGRSNMENVIIDGQDGTHFFWDGVWFDGVDNVDWRGFQAWAQNEAIKVNGSTLGMANLKLHQGKIGNAAVAVHIGGGFGGFVCDEVDIGVNGTNIVIDNALDAQPNREIFIGPNCWSDLTTAGDGIYVNDPLVNGGTLAIQGWVASANRNGIHIVKWPYGLVSVSGPTVFNNRLAGIKVDDPTTILKVSPATWVHANGIAP
jgi:hypothetical protein